jgi:hypothetical protein
MENVYEKVRVFYEEDEQNDESALSRDWVEGFLRQKAWQGCSEEQLDELWSHLKLFTAYIAEQDFEFLDSLVVDDYHQALWWIHDNFHDFDLTLKNTRRFFAVLVEFFEYLQSKNFVDALAVLQTALLEITGGRRLKLRKPPQRKNSISPKDADDSSAIGLPIEEMAMLVTAAVEGLMGKLGSYFQQTQFMNDFERALFLYTGPFESVPDDEYHDFWLGFWDYFLFDYHLIDNDFVPLEYFRAATADSLSPQEEQLMKELLNARYSVFYIHRIIDVEFVECIDLFTNEVFRLPQPDFDYRKIKRLLFFGHVFSGDLTLINYVTSIEVSPNLRRRIKEEVIMQKQIYEVQQAGATWQQFLARHALNVKYTVDILLSLSKVNVTPFNLVKKEYKKSGKASEYTAVTKFLTELMPEFGFSSYDVKLAQQLWADYCSVVHPKVRDNEIWAAAVLYVYSKMNGHHRVMATRLAGDLDKTSSGIYACGKKLKQVLELEEFDTRYLSEEGFIFMLLRN